MIPFRTSAWRKENKEHQATQCPEPRLGSGLVQRLGKHLDGGAAQEDSGRKRKQPGPATSHAVLALLCGILTTVLVVRAPFKAPAAVLLIGHFFLRVLGDTVSTSNIRSQHQRPAFPRRGEPWYSVRCCNSSPNNSRTRSLAPASARRPAAVPARRFCTTNPNYPEHDPRHRTCPFGAPSGPRRRPSDLGLQGRGDHARGALTTQPGAVDRCLRGPLIARGWTHLCGRVGEPRVTMMSLPTAATDAPTSH